MTKPATFDAKALAAEHRTFIETNLKIQLDDKRDFGVLKAVYNLTKGLVSGERLPRTKKLRIDHYRGIIRFMAIAMLYTDQSQNMVVANANINGQAVAVPANNAFFCRRLGIERSTLDGIIATVKRLGWYISNVRYGFYVCGNGRRHYGKNSIKRVFVGVYDLLGMGKKIRESIKNAVAYRQRTQKKTDKQLLEQLCEQEFHDFGYGKENQRRFEKRKAQRAAKLAENGANSAAETRNQENHAAKVAEQLELAAKGYTVAEIAAHQDGSTPIFDPIPY